MAAILLFMVLAGCSLLERESEEQPQQGGEKPSAPAHTVERSKNDRAASALDPDEFAELQLKHSRLVARIEELEGKFSRQQERLKIIERGLTLGLVPDELKPPSHEPVKGKPLSGNGKKTEKNSVAKNAGPENHEADQLAGGTHPDKAAVAHAVAGQEEANPVAPSASEVPIPAATREEFDKTFAAAHEDYRAGRYGKAIVAFSGIGQKFDDRLTGGVHKFWIARCWSGLKEMQTARQLFTEFIDAHPASPWAPRAKLELARVESALGLKETAIKRLRGVISEHPMDDVAEMAKAEMDRMSKTL